MADCIVVLACAAISIVFSCADSSSNNFAFCFGLFVFGLILTWDKEARTEWVRWGRFYIDNDVNTLLTSNDPEARLYGLVISGQYKERWADFVPPFLREKKSNGRFVRKKVAK